MPATIERRPATRRRPAVPRKVPITFEPSAEERAKRRSELITVSIVVLFVLAMFGLMIWAAAVKDPTVTYEFWQHPYL